MHKQTTCKLSKALPLTMIALLLLITPIRTKKEEIGIKVITQNINGQFDKEAELKIDKVIGLNKKNDIIVLNLQNIYGDIEKSTYFDEITGYKFSEEDKGYKKILDSLQNKIKSKRLLKKYDILIEFSNSLMTIVYVKGKFKEEMGMKDTKLKLDIIKKISFDSKTNFKDDKTSSLGHKGTMLLNLTLKKLKFVIVNSLFSDDKVKQVKEFTAIEGIIKNHRNLSLYGSNNTLKLKGNFAKHNNKYNYMLLWGGDFNVKMNNQETLTQYFKELVYKRYEEDYHKFTDENKGLIKFYEVFDFKNEKLNTNDSKKFLNSLKDYKEENFISKVIRLNEIRSSDTSVIEDDFYELINFKEAVIDFYATSEYRIDEGIENEKDDYVKYLSFEKHEELRYDERILTETNMSKVKLGKYVNEFKFNNSSNKPVSLNLKIAFKYFDELEPFYNGVKLNIYKDKEANEEVNEANDFIKYIADFAKIKSIEDILYDTQVTDDDSLAYYQQKSELYGIIKACVSEDESLGGIKQALGAKYEFSNDDEITAVKESQRILYMLGNGSGNFNSGERNSLVKMIRKLLI